MSARIAFAACSLVTLVVLGCTSSPEPASCAIPAASRCDDYIAVLAPQNERSFCESSGGTFASTWCTPQARVARCTVTTTTSSGTTTIRENFYPPSTIDQVRSLCLVDSGLPPTITYQLEEN